jgi:hypothetical protein
MSMAWGRGLSTLGAGAVGMGQTIMQRVREKQDEEHRQAQFGLAQNADARAGAQLGMAQEAHQSSMQPRFRFSQGPVAAELPMDETGFATAGQLGERFPAPPQPYAPTTREQYHGDMEASARIGAQYRAPQGYQPSTQEQWRADQEFSSTLRTGGEDPAMAERRRALSGSLGAPTTELQQTILDELARGRSKADLERMLDEAGLDDSTRTQARRYLMPLR